MSVAERTDLVAAVREWVEREVIPNASELEHADEYPAELVAQMKEMGLFGATIPEEHGGLGLDVTTYALIQVELARGWMSLSGVLNTHLMAAFMIAGFGTDEQRSRYLPRMATGDLHSAYSMTEPHAGSDVQAIRTRAVRDGDDWVITGTKHFISHADASDFVILFAATGARAAEADVPRRAEITAFLVDVDTPGLAVLPGYRSVSHRGYGNSVLVFDGCRVPGSAVLGEVGRGFEVANAWLGTTRLQVAASCLGRARRALDLATAHAATRRQFGRSIGRNQGVAFKLADMGTALESATWLTWRAAWLVDAAGSAEPGPEVDAAIAMAKLSATEMLAMVADEALQVHGGMGLMDELVLERIWRDARVERIWDGTSEIQRHIVSRSMLRAHGG